MEIKALNSTFRILIITHKAESAKISLHSHRSRLDVQVNVIDFGFAGLHIGQVHQCGVGLLDFLLENQRGPVLLLRAEHLALVHLKSNALPLFALKTGGHVDQRAAGLLVVLLFLIKPLRSRRPTQ